MMNIGKHARSVATALVLGVAVVGLAAGHAEARPKRPADNGIRCVRYYADGSMGFFLPGETIAVDDANGKGHTLQCQADGTWKDVTPATRQ
jgi:hypothetical protein